jgi:hypothetical protein
MRLLNAEYVLNEKHELEKSRLFHECNDARAPRYAILSHCWIDYEKLGYMKSLSQTCRTGNSGSFSRILSGKRVLPKSRALA